jgi:hypothetical protein
VLDRVKVFHYAKAASTPSHRDIGLELPWNDYEVATLCHRSAARISSRVETWAYRPRLTPSRRGAAVQSLFPAVYCTGGLLLHSQHSLRRPALPESSLAERFSRPRDGEKKGVAEATPLQSR